MGAGRGRQAGRAEHGPGLDYRPDKSGGQGENLSLWVEWSEWTVEQSQPPQGLHSAVLRQIKTKMLNCNNIPSDIFHLLQPGPASHTLPYLNLDKRSDARFTPSDLFRV